VCVRVWMPVDVDAWHVFLCPTKSHGIQKENINSGELVGFVRFSVDCEYVNRICISKQKQSAKNTTKNYE